MYLAKILHGRLTVTPMDDEEADVSENGQHIIRRPRKAKAWRIPGGAAAISQSPEGAAASARRVLEQPAPIEPKVNE